MKKIFSENNHQTATEGLVFPETWQTVLFRNYGKVPLERLAKTLETDEDTILREAASLGLEKVAFLGEWERSGYLSLIRDNWRLLPRDQILGLLNKSEEWLSSVLKEEDFFGEKLGEKPQTPRVVYTALDSAQRNSTEEIGKRIRSLQPERDSSFRISYEPSPDQVLFGKDSPADRLIYGYRTGCGDPLGADWENAFSEELLSAFASRGINGIWLHAIFYQLAETPFEFAEEGERKRRIEALNALVARAKKFGLRVWLYVNEPRCMPAAFFEKNPELCGYAENGFGSMCTSVPQVKEYLRRSAKSICEQVPELGGFLSITMSENLTHCRSKGKNLCPRCGGRPQEEIVAEINNLIRAGVRDAGSSAEVVAWTWAWFPSLGWNEEMILRAIALTDPEISIMSTSEDSLEIAAGETITDYSVAYPGPSEKTRRVLGFARETGHKIFAKVQLNDSWECPSVPYLPVFPLQYRHLKNLSELSLDGIMLSWTLGGYPSPVLEMAARFFEKGENFRLGDWYRETFGKDAALAEEACALFSAGLSELPCNTMFLYVGPMSRGAAEPMLSGGRSGRSGMIGYLFDDVEYWLSGMDPARMEKGLAKLLARWTEGISLLENAQGRRISEVKEMATAAKCVFSSARNHLCFQLARKEGDLDRLGEILLAEERNVAELLEKVQKDGRIGYEASNHYLFDVRNLIEKILSLEVEWSKLRKKVKT